MRDVGGKLGRSPSIVHWPSPTVGVVAANQAPNRLSWKAALLVIGVVVAIGGGVVIYETRGENDPLLGPPETTRPGIVPAGPSALELSAGPLVTGAAPCPDVEPSLIASATVAFLGTVTVLDEGLVQLTIDKNYTGADTETVKVTASRSVDYWLGPVSWDIGSQYLVSAHSGLVRFCGQTGRATTALQAMFDEAFPH